MTNDMHRTTEGRFKGVEKMVRATRETVQEAKNGAANKKNFQTQTNCISRGSPWLRIKKIMVGAAYA